MTLTRCTCPYTGLLCLSRDQRKVTRGEFTLAEMRFIEYSTNTSKSYRKSTKSFNQMYLLGELVNSPTNLVLMSSLLLSKEVKTSILSKVIQLKSMIWKVLVKKRKSLEFNPRLCFPQKRRFMSTAATLLLSLSSLYCYWGLVMNIIMHQTLSCGQSIDK